MCTSSETLAAGDSLTAPNLPENVTCSDAPPGPGNDTKLAEAGREALAPRTTGRKAQLETSQLRPGWTTGACAAAAASAAWHFLLSGEFPDPVTIDLPKGRRTAFALTQHSSGEGWAEVAVTKDAGDDPDVTHLAVIRARVQKGIPGGGIVFSGGSGVGTVTLPGLPLEVGQPAINPMPREYISSNLQAVSQRFGLSSTDLSVTISVDDGQQIAEKTWNSRIGILGGLSILGTTGVVVPYSCSAWIASIHRGIDVAVANGITHAAACTGSTSEAVAEKLHPGIELLDMGDFAGAVLKYLRKKPIPRLTIVGGVAKISKLSAGYLDLHSHRTKIQPGHLVKLVEQYEIASQTEVDQDLKVEIGQVSTVAHAVKLAAKAQIDLPQLIADSAAEQASEVLASSGVGVDVVIIDRTGNILAQSQILTS